MPTLLSALLMPIAQIECGDDFVIALMQNGTPTLTASPTLTRTLTLTLTLFLTLPLTLPLTLTRRRTGLGRALCEWCG